jgi:hypothetical protein
MLGARQWTLVTKDTNDQNLSHISLVIDRSKFPKISSILQQGIAAPFSPISPDMLKLLI